MTAPERFGANVRDLRRKAELSQEALGHVGGLHPTEISRLERGVREPRLGTIVKLALALGVAPADLLSGVS